MATFDTLLLGIGTHAKVRLSSDVPRKCDPARIHRLVVVLPVPHPSDTSREDVGRLHHHLCLGVTVLYISKDFPFVAGLLSEAMIERGLLASAFVFLGSIV